MNEVKLTRRQLMQYGAGAAVGLGMGRVLPASAQNAAIITKPIPSSGERLPVVGVGTNAYGVTAAEDLAARREVLRRLPELGGSVVDTARGYGTSEEVIGKIVTELGNRKRLFLATKTPMFGDISDPDAVLAVSFRQLQTDVIDLLQVHNLFGTETLLPAIEKAKAAGRVRYVGISTSTDNQYPDLLNAMRRYKLDFIQVDYSIDNRGAADEILPLAADRGMAVLINMPFGGRRNAANTFARVTDRPLPDWAADIDAKSWAQVFLKYIVSHPAITVAIPGITKASHLEDNLGATRGRLADGKLRQEMERYWDSLGT